MKTNVRRKKDGALLLVAPMAIWTILFVVCLLYTSSGMMYRMKQNAVGLGNICILSTMVLVMLSATSTMFIGTESSLMGRYPREIAVQDWDLERPDDVNAVIDDWLAENGWTAENRIDYVKEEFSGLLRDGKMIFDYTSDFNSGELVTRS